MKKLLVFLVISISVLLGSSVVTGLAQTGQDGYHFGYFDDGRHDAFYIEWWYFNVFSDDIQIVISYPIINPDDILRHGLAGVTATAYTEDGIVSEAEYFDPDEFEASGDMANVIVGDTNPPANYVSVNDDGSYHVVGYIHGEEHDISWDLTYTSEINPWFARDRQKVEIFSWEVMSWLVYMPGAWVRGIMNIDETEYSINAKGYHDHNWGEWIPTHALWNWAQYYDPQQSLAFEMGDFRFKRVGVVSIEVNGERTVFEKDNYFLIHKRWQYDPTTSKYFPMESWLYAENEQGRLVVRLDTIATEALVAPVKLAAFLPEVVVYEQTAHFVGRFWKKTEPKESTSFSGDGFKEYTALTF